MLPSVCVVVPTYWTRAGGERRADDAVYDHPTPVDGPSTLPALLESLAALDTGSFYLLLLVAVTGSDAAVYAEDRVRDMLRQHSGLQTLIFGIDELRWFHDLLVDRGASDARDFLSLQNYPRIRNLQLAVPLALGSGAIVALDDDEIVTDPDFLQKAVQPLGTSVNGRNVDGLSGHYLQEDGTILLYIDPEKAASPNLFDRKAAIMNEATEMLDREDGDIVETPFCFGGNMEFTAEMAAKVGFDPGITRGEDIDYLINARMEGKHFFLRKDLRILHKPPRGGSYKDATSSKTEQDIVRFVYEHAKLRASQSDSVVQPVTADELMPYPGEFLKEDIAHDAEGALRATGYAGDPAAFMERVQDSVQGRVEAYLRFRQRWPQVMDLLRDDSQVTDFLAPQLVTH